MSINVRVTTSNLQAKAREASRRAAEIVMGELFAAFQQSFTAKAWDWPRPTERAAGPTVGSPRNLIDTGNLRQTGTYQMTGPYQATFRWSAQYATAVHEGAYIYPWGNRDAERVLLPPRPWTRAVLGQEDVSGVRVYNLGERLQDVWMAQFRRR